MRGPQLRRSTEFVDVEIKYEVLGEKIDPSGDFVGYLAFKTSEFGDEPGDDFNDPEWHQAAWITKPGTQALALKVGPNGVFLEPGVWHVFAGLDGPVQTPLMYGGTRKIR